MVALVASLTFMGLGIYSITGPRDAKSLWSLGIGVVSETALINGIEPDASIGINNLFCIFLANLPQLIFSVLYFQYNAIFTCMLAAKEWSEFGVQRKPVRVSSSPRGAQRTRYFLQLPYAFSIPLIVASIAIHWLISQSIFVVAIEKLQDEDFRQDWFLVKCGYSPLAMLLVILASFMMVLAVVAVARFKLPSAAPIVGSCSFALAAACHDTSGAARPNLSLAPIMWGVMKVEADGSRWSNHCGFSEEDVQSPVPGEYYS
jgi:hypothetical protein